MLIHATPGQEAGFIRLQVHTNHSTEYRVYKVWKADAIAAATSGTREGFRNLLGACPQ